MARIAHNKLTTDVWVERAKAKHGDRYDYSESDYIDSSTKIKVICRDHGPFMVWPINHVSKEHNCPGCTGNRKATLAEFIEQANKVHDGKYDYSKSVYKRNRVPLTVECSEHGEFQISPTNHIRKGIGCPKCSHLYSPTTAEWVEKAMDIHGDRYLYKKTNYKNQTTKVVITCRDHGDWLASPSSHILNGTGCPKCANTERGKSRRLTNSQFVDRARAVHGDFYSYDSVKYRTAKMPIWIGCPLHGDFKIIPYNHLQGRGCPDCGQNGGPTNVYLVSVSVNQETFLKIGITNRTVKKRFYHDSLLGFRFRTIGLICCETRGKALQIEKQLHSELCQYSYRPENSFHGETECFDINASSEVVSVFKKQGVA